MSTGSRVCAIGIVCPAFSVCARAALFQFEVLQADRRDRLHDRPRVGRQRFDFLFELEGRDRREAPGARVLVGLQRADDPDARARDPHLVGGLQAGGLRQFDLDVVRRHERQAVVGVVGEEHGHDDDQRRDRADQQRARGERVATTVHGVSVGSQLSSSPSTNGEEPSAAGWVAAPGQRRSCPVFSPSSAACGLAAGVRVFARAELEVGEDAGDVHVVAVGVLVAGALAERAQRAREVGRVGAEDGGDRNRFLQRRDADRRGRRQLLGEPGERAHEVGEVVVGAGAAERLAEVAPPPASPWSPAGAGVRAASSATSSSAWIP